MSARPVALALLAALLAACSAVPPANPARGLPPEAPWAGGVLALHCPHVACRLSAVDPATGQDLPAGPAVSLNNAWPVARLSADGRTLALVDNPTDQASGGAVLSVVDLAAGRALTTTLTSGFTWINTLALSPDGAQVAVVPGDSTGYPPVYSVSALAARTLARTAAGQLDFLPRVMAYTPDGRWLLAYGADNGPAFTGLDSTARAAVLDAATLEVLWETALPDVRDGQFPPDAAGNPPGGEYLEPAAVLDPARARLYLVHADADRLTTVDFAARTAQSAALLPARGWLDTWLAWTAETAEAKTLNGGRKRAVLTPDGRRLFVAGTRTRGEPQTDQTWTLSEEALPAQSIDLATGQVTPLGVNANQVDLSADGRQLFLRGARSEFPNGVAAVWTDVLDAASGQALGHWPEAWLRPALRLDGRPIVLTAADRPDGHLQWGAFDPVTLARLYRATGAAAETNRWLDVP